MDALTGFLSEHAIFMIQEGVQEVEFYRSMIAQLDARITEADKAFEQQLEKIKTFPDQ